MPVLRSLRRRFERDRPLAGLRIGASLQVTAETAVLMRALEAGGAEPALCPANPLTTQDEVADALGVNLTKLRPDQAEYIGVPVEGPYKPDHYRY